MVILISIFITTDNLLDSSVLSVPAHAYVIQISPDAPPLFCTRRKRSRIFEQPLNPLPLPPAHPTHPGEWGGGASDGRKTERQKKRRPVIKLFNYESEYRHQSNLKRLAAAAVAAAAMAVPYRQQLRPHQRIRPTSTC